MTIRYSPLAVAKEVAVFMMANQTLLIGKVHSPATIYHSAYEVREQIKLRHGNGVELPTLADVLASLNDPAQTRFEPIRKLNAARSMKRIDRFAHLLKQIDEVLLDNPLL